MLLPIEGWPGRLEVRPVANTLRSLCIIKSATKGKIASSIGASSLWWRIEKRRLPRKGAVRQSPDGRKRNPSVVSTSRNRIVVSCTFPSVGEALLRRFAFDLPRGFDNCPRFQRGHNELFSFPHSAVYSPLCPRPRIRLNIYRS